MAGLSGAGKTTLCAGLSARHDLPWIELDSLYHGPNWTPRASFVADVEEFVAGSAWVVELQYRQVRPLIAARADTVLWLDYPTTLCVRRLLVRTVTRRLRRTELWNGNVEPPLRTVFTDPEHILRFTWRHRHKYRSALPTLEGRFPGLTVVRLRHPRETERWVARLAHGD